MNQPAEVFFTQSDRTLNSTVDIVLDSSLDFSYCYDQFRNMNHALCSVPIVVIPQNRSANHQHRVRLTFHSLDNDFEFQDLFYWLALLPDSLSLFVNKTGKYMHGFIAASQCVHG